MEEKLALPQLMAQPLLVDMSHGPMAYLMLSPYGGASRREIKEFPGLTSLVTRSMVAKAEGSKWRFWINPDGTVGTGFDGWVVGAEMKVPDAWVMLARTAQQIVVVYAPDLRHPTTQEMSRFLAGRSGWWATALLGDLDDPFATVS